MSLILAIEPDRRQSLMLVSLSRARLNVEFVLGESAGRAFEAIGPRRPDLVLTSARLTAADESTLSKRLRGFEAAGTPVRRIAIPQLTAPSKKGGVTAKNKGPHVHAPAYCDPLVFSEQILDCLEMAAAERAALDAAQAELEEACAAEVGPRPSPNVAPVAAVMPELGATPQPVAFAAASEDTATEPLGVLLEPEPAIPLQPSLPAYSDEIIQEELADDSNGDWEDLVLEEEAVIELDSLAEPLELEGDFVIDDQTTAWRIAESSLEALSVTDEVAITTAEPDREPGALSTETPAVDAIEYDSTTDAVEPDPGQTLGPDSVEPVTATDAVTDAEAPIVCGSPLQEPEPEPTPPNDAATIALPLSNDPPEVDPALGAISPSAATPVLEETALAIVEAAPVSAPIEDPQPTPGTLGEAITPTAPDIQIPCEIPRELMPWRPKTILATPIRTLPVPDEWGFFDPQQCGFEALSAKLNEMIERSASA